MPASQRPQHNLVVVGASAGGVETLRRVVADLPGDLDATVCVVLHLAPSSPSALPRILERSGRLPCRAARDGEPLEPSQILVAPPDRHLVIEDGHVRLTVGPRENGHRPAIDALFRSAAAERGGQVIGVILSGTRDDGSVGLAFIKANGGRAIVQDPKEAIYAGMPRSALASVAADAVVPSDRVGATVVAMVNGDKLPPGGEPPEEELSEGELPPVGGPTEGELPPVGGPTEPTPAAAVPRQGSARGITALTTICPECGGVLSEQHQAGVVQWECRVGHRYSADSLLNAQAEDVEGAMWAAVRALEDRRLLLERMGTRFESRGQEISARSVRRRADDAARQAQMVREALASAALTSLREMGENGQERDLESLEDSEEGLAS